MGQKDIGVDFSLFRTKCSVTQVVELEGFLSLLC